MKEEKRAIDVLVCVSSCLRAVVAAPGGRRDRGCARSWKSDGEPVY